MTIKVAVVGATGRMGKLALDLIEGAQDLRLHAALDSKSELTELLGADVVLDVTRLEVSESVVDFAIQNGLKVVVGTSGWGAAKLATLEAKLAKAGNGAAVVIVPNFSVGSMLGSMEAHLKQPEKRKRPKPDGYTKIMLADLKARGWELREIAE